MNARLMLCLWLFGAMAAAAAMIDCPECSKQISDRAAACPGCGLPAAEFHKAAEVGAASTAPVPQAPSRVAKDESIVRVPKAELAGWVQEGYRGDHLPDGTPHGFGRMNKGGSAYLGEWANGRRHGVGAYTNASGDSYKGYWKDDQKDGGGLYKWSSGAMYSGQWARNMMNGEGKYRFPDGSIYRGTWEDNIIDGEGMLTRADGTVAKMTYRDGKVVWSADVSSETFNYNPDANADGDISDDEMNQFEKRRRVFEMRQADQRSVEEKASAAEGAQAQVQGKPTDVIDDATRVMSLLNSFK